MLYQLPPRQLRRRAAHTHLPQQTTFVQARDIVVLDKSLEVQYTKRVDGSLDTAYADLDQHAEG